ncbi:N-acetylmuramoyl-L-alanine amidase [Thalassobacillus sp. C254]|uniref:N-acetylmuramoyl-L-alanine amidase n=1 Tax=Thalassobacillus sp. C254 TaxID=1225341 RepID=UPI0006D2C557|nr:N-acetylmuramoyl-L-alanine amidase [Thalassobacillus sp. C254]
MEMIQLTTGHSALKTCENFLQFFSNGVKVYIDPGHGGNDPGAVGNGLREKDLCLSTALQLRDILLNEYSGVQIRMSRTTDVFRTLGERVRDANNWGADIFISIHYNAAVAAARGFETFRYRGAPTRTRNIHSSLHPAMFNHAFRGKMPDRGTKTAGFYVIKHTNMPAILTEGGFVTNSSDARLLKQSSFIREIAEAHAVGIAEALGLRKRTQSSGSTSTGKSAWTGQILREGSRGPLVTSLQEMLLNHGEDLGRHGADGVFGPATKAAVRSFQSSAGISVDGVAGPQTYRELQKNPELEIWS